MEITLKKDGWHKKLQIFVLNNPPTFNNFCPYFWLTIFCIIFTFIIPIVPAWCLLKIMAKGIAWPFLKFAEYYEKFICLPFWEKIALKMPEFDILKSWTLYVNENYYESLHTSDGELNRGLYDDYMFWANEGATWKMSSKKRDAFLKKFELWKNATPDWEAKLAAIREKQRVLREQHLKDLHDMQIKMYAQQELDRKNAELRKKRRQQAMSAIVKYTKWLAYVLLSALGIVVCYLVYLFVMLVIDWINWGVAHFNYANFILTLKIIGWVILGICTAIMLFFIIKKCTKNITLEFKDTYFAKIFIAIGSFLGRHLATFFKGVWKVLSFIGMFIKTTKEDYCPGINWVDDNKAN